MIVNPTQTSPVYAVHLVQVISTSRMMTAHDVFTERLYLLATRDRAPFANAHDFSAVSARRWRVHTRIQCEWHVSPLMTANQSRPQ